VRLDVSCGGTSSLMLYAAVLALSKRNSNAAEIIIFLHRLTQVLIEYFKELEEESIRDNFVIIYELMDEMMDFGFPQTTESKILQECV
jgi:AP-1 complex subunit mu